MNFFDKYKWYILGGIGLVGLGTIGAFLYTFFKFKNPKTILFLGDSISTGETTYPAKIKKERPDLDIDIVAQGGKTTDWMLDRLKEQLSQKKYDRVYVYGGINDAFNTKKPEDIYKNLQEMVNLVDKQGGYTFILKGYLPNDEYLAVENMKPTRYVTTKEAYIPLINNYITFQENVEKNVKKAHFIERFDLGNTTSDGTHPNGTGQNMIKEIVLKTLPK